MGSPYTTPVNVLVNGSEAEPSCLPRLTFMWTSFVRPFLRTFKDARETGPLAALPPGWTFGEERFDPFPEVFAHVGLDDQVRSPAWRRHLDADAAQRLLGRLQREGRMLGKEGGDLHDPRLQRLLGLDHLVHEPDRLRLVSTHQHRRQDRLVTAGAAD